jgi:hypothetical protein
MEELEWLFKSSNLPDRAAKYNTVKAALSANGGEEVPVAWVVFADNGNIRIWGREKPEAFPDAAPLYLSPTVKKSLTVQSEPIGYADPDSLNDYRAGDRLHIPVYRPDASAEWQSGIPVYTHPAPPSVAVPEQREWNQVTGRDGFKYTEGWNACREAMLTDAPSPDHSGDANKMVDVECCCENPEPEEGPAMASDCCPIHNVFPQHCENCAQDDGHDHTTDAGKVATIPLDPRYQEHRPLITNAMKAAHIGEYSVDVEYPEVDEDGELTGLSVDSGVTIPWDTCKRIYREMAKTAMTVDSAAPSVPENDAGADAVIQFKDELLKSVKPIFRPHIEGVCAVVLERLRTAGDEENDQ